MKRRIAILLCTAALLLSVNLPVAFAAGGPYYPISVDEYTYGNFDELRIQKVYQLSLSDDPSGIPTEDFERNGRLFYLLDITRKDEIGVDTQDYTDTITQDSDTNDLAQILKPLDAHREVETEDGYSGLLALDYTSVTVEAKGYTTSTKSLSATRTYPNLSDADLSLIPKTVTDSGKTLTLGAVEWSGGANGYYTATATYSGTSSTRYATGYTVTASYTGQVAKTGCDVIIYTAVFGSKELDQSAKPEQTPDDGHTPNTEREPVQTASGVNIFYIVGCVSGVLALLVFGLYLVQRKKEKGKEDIPA